MFLIKQIQLRPVALPLVQPFVTAQSTMTKRPLTLVAVQVADTRGEGSAWGYGEVQSFDQVGYSPETQNLSRQFLSQELGPALLGQTFSNLTEVLRMLQAGSKGYSFARAGLETALWDAWGKIQNKSLSTMLGGTQTQVPVGIALGFPKDSTVWRKKIVAAQQQGYQRIKLKLVGSEFSLSGLIDLLAQFPKQAFSLDANESLTVDQALSLNQLPDNVLFVEQPLPAGADWELTTIQQQLRLPISLDESLRSLSDVKRLLAMGAGRAVTVKAGMLGGISAAKDALQIAHQYQASAWVGGMFGSGLGRHVDLALASLPGWAYPADISDSRRYFETDLINEQLVVEDGFLPVPDRPGIGVTMSWGKIEQLQTGPTEDIKKSR
ncbi:o-succinylbenzoate synthase [Leuconostocaceae bacterium ESL0723]|nr:o-succinylbenzoate synthase [Leuconostocaceae bacterium ESL0723]